MSESSSPKPGKTVTLEALLRLKRAERPPAEFWDGFEERLHGRILREVMAEPRQERVAWRLRARPFWLAAPLAAALALMIWTPGGPGVAVMSHAPALEIAAHGESAVALDASVQAPATMVEAQFVSDLLSPAWSRTSSSFTRVLASEMLATAPASSVYVANQLGRAGALDLGSPAAGFDRF